MYQLSALDNLMVDGESPALPLHMSAVMVYDTGGKRGADALARIFRERFESVIASHFPILGCKVERLPLHLDRAYWVEDQDFSLGRHFKHVALPKPRDWPALYRLIGSFHAQPLDTRWPLWECMLVEGLDKLEGIPPGATALLLKIHHAVLDGKGALRLANSFHNLGAEEDAPLLIERDATAPPHQADFQPPSMLEKYGRAWWHSVERPVDLGATLLKLVPQLWPTRHQGPKSAACTAPRSIFNQPVSAERVVGHIAMDFPALRRLEKRHGCTINDLALSVIAGALRGYLAQRDALPEEDLVALMPIDIRDHGDEGSLGNHVSVARVSLGTGTGNVLQRLQKIHAATSRGKREHGRGSSNTLLELVDEVHPSVLIWLGDWLVASGHLKDLPQPANTVVTNVPGQREELYIGKARLVDYLGLGPLAPNVGLFHTVSSTAEKVNISFLSTPELVGDGHEYQQCLATSWEKLCRARKRR